MFVIEGLFNIRFISDLYTCTCKTSVTFGK